MILLQADTNKLKNDYGLICAGQVELTTLAVSKLKNSSLKKSGIATLTEKILGVPYKKNKRATMSNWEIRDLTHAQIQYAAADAWLSFSILMALLNYKAIPAVAPQNLKAEETVSGNVVHLSSKPQLLDRLFSVLFFSPFLLNSVMSSRIVAT